MFEFGTQAPMHDPCGLYRKLLQTQAEQLCELLTKRLIRTCQSQAPGLMSSAEIKNLWEEICVACRTDAVFQSAYGEHLELCMISLIEALPPLERQMLWLMTDAGAAYAALPEWLVTEEAMHHGGSPLARPEHPWPSLNPNEWPVDARAIARDIIHEYVLYECMNYENKRIRACTGY